MLIASKDRRRDQAEYEFQEWFEKDKEKRDEKSKKVKDFVDKINEDKVNKKKEASRKYNYWKEQKDFDAYLNNESQMIIEEREKRKSKDDLYRRKANKQVFNSWLNKKHQERQDTRQKVNRKIRTWNI